MTLYPANQALDVSTHSAEWRSRLEDPKTQALMTQGISLILGPEAASLPRGLQSKLIKTYSLWSSGQIALGDCNADLRPKFDNGKKSALSQIMNKMSVLHASTFQHSNDNIPQVDQKGKGQKFIEVIDQLRQIQALPADLSRMTVRDIGGGDGSMMNQIDKEYLHLKKEPAIYEVATYENPKCKQIKYNEDFTIPEADSTIDLATMNMVLHHIEDPNFTLRELHRVMKNEGVFIMRETDTQGDRGVDSFQHVMDHIWYKSSSHASTVTGVPLKMQFRTKEEVVELFRKNGFEPVYVAEHPNDKDNVFYPKFFAFKCVKQKPTDPVPTEKFNYCITPPVEPLFC